jgi:polar amino acid transport system ATP-binding protein
MDEGSIYEEGPPEQIFGSPRREKTQAFIHRVKSFIYEIPSEHYDFVEMMNNLRNFCWSNGLSLPQSNKADLMVEELASLLPKRGGAQFEFHFPEDKSSFEITASYPGPDHSILRGDDLSVTIIQKSAANTKHEFDRDNNVNRLVIDW